MSTIRSSPLLRRLVDLNALDNQVAGIETFSVGVGFGVLEQADEEFGGFLGPAGFADAELFACTECIPSALFSSTHISSFRLLL